MLFSLFSKFYSRIPYYQSKVPVGHSLTTLIRNGIAVGNFNLSGQVGSNNNNNPPSYFFNGQQNIFIITYSFYVKCFNISRNIIKYHIYSGYVYFTIQFIIYFPFLAKNFIGTTTQTFLWEYYFL